MIEFFVPGLPPSVNNCYTRTRHGGRVLTREAQEYMEWMWSHCPVDYYYPITYKIFLNVAVIMPDKRIRDVDNFAKIIFDGLQKGDIIKNDSQIKDFRIFENGVDLNGCGIFIQIYELEKAHVIIEEVV